MFWGLVIEPGKRYAQTVSKSFHVSMAALDSASAPAAELSSLQLEVNDQTYTLCSLAKGTLQQHLDLNFETGTRIVFTTKGKGNIHLSGYVIPEDDDDFGQDESEEEESDEEAAVNSSKAAAALKLAALNQQLNSKRKGDNDVGSNAKKAKAEVANDDSESDEDDDDDMGSDMGSLSSEEDSEEEAVSPAKNLNSNKKGGAPNAQQSKVLTPKPQPQQGQTPKGQQGQKVQTPKQQPQQGKQQNQNNQKGGKLNNVSGAASPNTSVASSGAGSPGSKKKNKKRKNNKKGGQGTPGNN